MSYLRALILALCLLFLIVVQGPVPAQTQTCAVEVLNGGFEEPSSGEAWLIDHWTPVGTDLGTRAANPTDPGTRSFSPRCDSECQTEYYQALDVTQCRGQTLDVTGKLYVDEWAYCHVAWLLTDTDQCGTALGTRNVVGRDCVDLPYEDTWYPITTTVTIPTTTGNTNDYLCLYIYGTRNVIYIDDISVSPSGVTSVEATRFMGWTGGGLALSIGLLAGGSVVLWRWARKR